MHSVLVYGTLRPGNTKTVLVPGVLYDVGSFPGIRLTEGSYIDDAKPGVNTYPSFTVCERIQVDDEGLARLDRYEGYREDSPETSLYIRQRITNVWEGTDDFIYEFNEECSHLRKIDSGDWLLHRNQEHGSAAGLGSNAIAMI